MLQNTGARGRDTCVLSQAHSKVAGCVGQGPGERQLPPKSGIGVGGGENNGELTWDFHMQAQVKL